MPNHRVYRDCPYCGNSFSYVEMKQHRARCPKHPLAVDCRFCGERLYLRKNFQPHVAMCPNMPPIPEGHRLCSACQYILPLSAFAMDSRRKECLKCYKTKATKTRQTPEYKAKHRATNIRWMYNLTQAQYDAKRDEQNGRCAICRKLPSGGKKEKHLHVDHKHDKSKQVRGLLCHHCNHVIGHCREDIAILIGSIGYLCSYGVLQAVS